jgi:hypothetical protein
VPAYWRSGRASAVCDDAGILFDCSGTPLDQDWHCRYDELTAFVHVLRQTWAEEVVGEMFAEAARRVPGLPAAPPPRPPPAPVVRGNPFRKRRGARKPPAPPPASPPPTVPPGFSDEALQALRARATRAARALDPAFPGALGAPLCTAVDLDFGPGLERRTYACAAEGRSFTLDVIAEVRDGIGGPVPYPVRATFSIGGLPAGCAVSGAWTGHAVEAQVAGPEDRAAEALRVLRGA